jgi:hypothetical protein
MKMFEDANIPIQSWIFSTICIGALELFFRSADLLLWNEDGKRLWVAYYVGVIVGAFKKGVSLCLMVMIGCGWGVIRDDLGPIMKKINFLGGLYITVSVVADILAVIAMTEVQHLSYQEEKEIIDVVLILALVLFLIDVIFLFWIIDSMNSTMDYLESMKQTSKLMRYLRLRCMLMFAILFGVIWSVLYMVEQFDQGILSSESKWVVNASMELNYLFVLVTVAVLWRPQQNAREYAYVMELPGFTTAMEEGDDENGVMELTAVVPSAMDLSDDDDDDDNFVGKTSSEGFQDEPSN